jgi:succinyl-diaminopimelate desuccinylase
MSVGRDGASDAISFLEVGIPAVEFGPLGGGHHGPEEWVSIESLSKYRRALVDFVQRLPKSLDRGDPPLRAVEGGRA